MNGRVKSSVLLREGLQRFADQSGLILQQTKTLDHLLSREGSTTSCIFTETDIATDHQRQSFTICDKENSNDIETSYYRYPSQHYVLSPLLDDHSKEVFIEKLCESYNQYRDVVALTIEEQKGLLFVRAITPQEAIDAIDRMIVEVIHQSCDEHLERATNRLARRTRPPLAPQTTSAATRLFKSLRKTKKTILRSNDPEVNAEEATRNRYAELWQDRREPLDITTPSVIGTLECSTSNFGSIVHFISKYNSSKSAGGDGIHTVVLKALLESSFPEHLASLFDMICEIGATPTRWNTGNYNSHFVSW
jgi:hypothetical protein